MLSVSLTPKASLFQGKGGSGWNVDAKEVEFDSSAPAQQSQFLTSAMTESVNRSLSGGGGGGPSAAENHPSLAGHASKLAPFAPLRWKSSAKSVNYYDYSKSQGYW